MEAPHAAGALSFGLLIPDLGETEIFEPILSRHDGVAARVRARAHLGKPQWRGQHLLRLGCRRIAFVALPNAAATVDAREAGYREVS